MFANGYVGTSEDAVRIRRQEQERQKQRQKYEALAAEKHREAQSAGLRQFASTTSEALEHAFKNETIGLVTKADFVKKRTTLQDRLEEEQRRKQEAEEALAAQEKERRRKATQSARAGKLSFLQDEEGDDGDGGVGPSRGSLPASRLGFKLPAAPQTQQQADHDGGAAPGGGDAAAGAAVRPREASPDSDLSPAKRPRKVGKNPTVATDFLPDRDRAKMEAELRAQLKKEWQAQQDKVKAEPLLIVYSYWDGSGHRREIRVKKGDTIGAFLKAVKEQLVPDFRDLRHVSVDNLMYVKEDIILPHHHTFYDLIINKARGKSGPLFDFGVHEDIRVHNDASREKNESHAGKVVERHWYDRNKHIFPASRWEIYDPEKSYDTYTIYGEH